MVMFSEETEMRSAVKELLEEAAECLERDFGAKYFNCVEEAQRIINEFPEYFKGDAHFPLGKSGLFVKL